MYRNALHLAVLALHCTLYMYKRTLVFRKAVLSEAYRFGIAPGKAANTIERECLVRLYIRASLGRMENGPSELKERPLLCVAWVSDNSTLHVDQATAVASL